MASTFVRGVLILLVLAALCPGCIRSGQEETEGERAGGAPIRTATRQNEPGYLGPLENKWLEIKHGTPGVRLEQIIQLDLDESFSRVMAARDGSGEIALCTAKRLFMFDAGLALRELQLPPVPAGLTASSSIDVLGAPGHPKYFVIRECGKAGDLPDLLQVCDALSGTVVLECGMKTDGSTSRKERLLPWAAGSVPDERGEFAGVLVTDNANAYFVEPEGRQRVVRHGYARVIGHVPGAAVLEGREAIELLTVRSGKPCFSQVMKLGKNEGVWVYPDRWPSESFSQTCNDGPFGFCVRDHQRKLYWNYTLATGDGLVYLHESLRAPDAISSSAHIRKDGVEQAVAWVGMEVPMQFGTGPGAKRRRGEAQVVFHVHPTGKAADADTEYRALPFGTPGLLCNGSTGLVMWCGKQGWRVSMLPESE